MQTARCTYRTYNKLPTDESFMVFERLDNGTTVKAVNYYRSYDVDWYELYAVSDGTYLGWVDVNYIDFYE